MECNSAPHLINLIRRYSLGLIFCQGQRVCEALEPRLAHSSYPGFCSMKLLEVFLLPLDGMLVHRRSLPRNLLSFPQQSVGTRLYTCVERGTVRVKCLAQAKNTTQCPRPGLEPEPLARPESSAQTVRPPRLPRRASTQN